MKRMFALFGTSEEVVSEEKFKSLVFGSYKLTIVPIGIERSGKTAFLRSFRDKGFDSEYRSSVAAEYEVEHRVVKTDDRDYKQCVVWDVPGKEKFLHLYVNHFFQVGDYSTTDLREDTLVLWFIDPLRAEESVEYINKMAAHLNPTISPSKHYLIVNKMDEVQDYYLNVLDVDIVSSLNIERVFHVSSKTGEGFAEVKSHFGSLKPEHFDSIEPKSSEAEVGHLSKIVMLGPEGAGKTSLLKRKAWGVYQGEQRHFSGVSGSPVFVTLNTVKFPDVFKCMDLSGQEIKGHMLNVYFRDVEVFLCCVDASSQGSVLKAIEYFIRLRCHTQMQPFKDTKAYLVFTKTDIAPEANFDVLSKRIVAAINSSATIEKVMGEGYSSKAIPEIQFLEGYFACSAKEAHGINEIFDELQRKVFDSRDVLENTKKISLSRRPVGKPTPNRYSVSSKFVVGTPPRPDKDQNLSEGGRRNFGKRY